MARIAVVARGNAVEKDGFVCFQRLDVQLLRGLCKHGHQVVCISPLIQFSNPLYSVFSIYDDKITDNNISFIPLSSYNRSQMSFLHKLIIWGKAAKQMWRPIRTCDELMVFMPSPIGLLGFAIGKILGMPMVVYYGGDWSAYLGGTQPRRSKGAQAYIKISSYIRGLLERFVYLQSPMLLVRNQEVYNSLSSCRSGVHIAAPFTSFSIQDIFQREDTCADGGIICLTVGDMVPNKGVSDILRAIRILLDMGYPIQWWHAGSSWPEYQAEIESLIENLHLSSHVKVHGYQKHDELLSLYRQSDIFILASRSEGMPRVLAEAMTQSLPVIATRVGGVSAALKDEYHALLIEPENPNSIAFAVLRLINDSMLRKILIHHGRVWAIEELSRADPVQQILSVLNCRHD